MSVLCGQGQQRTTYFLITSPTDKGLFTDHIQKRKVKRGCKMNGVDNRLRVTYRPESSGYQADKLNKEFNPFSTCALRNVFVGL